ncbi:uncharacterized protein LOC110097908 [Dendrobium catenatum]|uniref:uncharacterized protein LOC110097908 n=1 Tax=Dendrobium catenatum TaxID=906689 RepID=UPI0009F320FB|nr:uncharacterized protein LOC110097908 [Dendrobium catenatum]XP_020680210.1 uncharacterized protein LOC110097908 [Dendrobium catenatum]XP_020680211.1 uncharacterized protein LOC110097908 [Dendrobium catenatum]XP_020680212.1 uncharacterized protein LOC110097908 [Dendrobium catenatum]XP_020680213.1 uncharacterized protein LOC110097908 [Dendrobium catenatum]XP_020680214.1 uncharacterized protein LOC110097908 [Dendrobium catenatum]XP_028557298.1 uncharacterized protein LOC110097908 [Dendrobium c
MEHPSSSPLRFLIRPPPPATTSPAAAPIATTPTPPHSISSSNPPPPNLNPTPAPSSSSSSDPLTTSVSPSPIGVVVVGFLGSKPSTDLTHLINRLLDDNVFGSANLEKNIPTSLIPDATDWFDRRRIGYHYEPEKGMVYLLYSPSSPSRLLLLSSSTSDERDEGAISVLEECEAEDIRYMLLMFSVCHVIVFVHEGFRFDIQILKKFRMLQAAKHALTPFWRSQIAPLVSPKQSLAIPQPNDVGASSVSAPTRRGGSSSRPGSAISLMSGSGSHPSILPGLCIPVVLFVFEDDFTDGSSAMTNVDEMTDAYRQNLAVKGSGSVVMLARPASKAEGSFRKRLQSSLEAQIRFLIKKCRVLSGTDHSHSGSRGVGSANSHPLFLLDASRVVVLLDRSVNQRGEPLNFVTSLIEEALNSKNRVDVLMLENHSENLHNEDIQSVKDFILRQADMLRGRGGLPSNVNSGSVAGVGVVAAAAAAAASAAAVKLASAPELPSLESWLKATNHILEALLSLGHGLTDEIRSTARLPLQRSTTETQDRHAVEDSISCLESCKGMNMKFSVSWCKRALPAAKELYLKDLPAYYPTSMHNTHLENALLAFNSMVKGPAVKMFKNKLADECTSIWEAGRQLCDAVSLTRNPCMHRRHDINNNNSSKEDAIIQHSSGYVFLHACACGRSRRLRDDPFDFESANITFNHFTNCENLLPSLFISNFGIGGPLPPASWSLRRVGGARYYEPSKGLIQTGFCSAHKFLMKWTISFDKQNETDSFSFGVTGKSYVESLNPGPKVMPARDERKKKSAETKPSEVQLTSEIQRKTSEPVPSNATSISFGKGLPSFTMKKPFAEVVAGIATADSTSLALKQRKHIKDITDKGIRQSSLANQNDGRKNAMDDQQASQGPEHISAIESSIKPETNCQTNANSYLQIGTNIVPVDMFNNGEINRTSSSKQSIVYVGFEHECPFGHRFLLSLEHLKNIDSSYSLSSKQYSSTNVSEGKCAETKTGVHEMLDHYSSGKVASVTNLRKNNKLNESVSTNGGQNHESFTVFSREGMENAQSVHRLPLLSESIHPLEGKLSHARLDDGSSAFSLLTRDLPVYMNCPHCNNSAIQAQQKVKFASKISQLQRIFLVTPPFPTVLATCPVIQFEESCLPPTIPERKQQSHFSFGCWVILPPESFITLRLPFIYGIRKDDGILQPLNHFEDKPELTAWLAKGTTLQVLSVGHESNKESQMK